MSILFLVLPLAIVIAGVAVWAYVWSARGGQFDDLDTPAVRMLHDDETPLPPGGADHADRSHLRAKTRP